MSRRRRGISPAAGDTGDDVLPITQADYLAGGISINVDRVPAMSGMRFGFLLDGADS